MNFESGNSLYMAMASDSFGGLFLYKKKSQTFILKENEDKSQIFIHI